MTALLLATHHWHGYPGFWFPLIPLLFLSLWIAAFVFIGRRWRHGGWRSGESVLAERYARGEIDETEYLERRTVLRRKA
jgi:putative membrane protein